MKATAGATSQAVLRGAPRPARRADRAAAETLATTLVPSVTVTARAGTEGRLFGSVTAGDIAAAIEAQTNVQIDRRKLVLAEPIKSLGTHVVPAKFRTPTSSSSSQSTSWPSEAGTGCVHSSSPSIRRYVRKCVQSVCVAGLPPVYPQEGDGSSTAIPPTCS